MSITSLAFYPSLGYNLLRNYLAPQNWAWYSRVDDRLIVGAMPFKSMQEELINKENVGGVVCCTEPYELTAAMAMQPEDWENAGVKFHAVPMTDFFGSAARAEVNSAVLFMENIAKSGKTIYVHCKAGRTRSATVATCYLMKTRNWLPNAAFEQIKSCRPQVLMRNPQWRTANEYRRFLDKEQGSRQPFE